MYFDYLEKLQGEINKIDEKAIKSLINYIVKYNNSGRRIFIIGNGGSASLADHFACDLSKTVLGKNGKSDCNFQVESLIANSAIITAWANDLSYDEIFSSQLINRARKDDLLIAISGSGNSKNIISAIKIARERGIRTFALLGFGGGKALPLVDDALVIQSDDYGIVEDCHTIITHLVTDWFKQYGKFINQYKSTIVQ